MAKYLWYAILIAVISSASSIRSWISSSEMSKNHRVIRSTTDNKTIQAKSRTKRAFIDDKMAKAVVDAHNEFRAALGEEHDEPVPSNMKFMTWDPSLAYTSLWYVKKCIFEHSENEERYTKYFNKWNGENLWAGEGDYRDNFDPREAVKAWFDEYLDYEFETKYCEPGKMCGHYTQLVWADTYKIGCAWTMCYNFDTTFGPIWDEAGYMVCHYAPGGNLKGEPIYKVGERCSECEVNDTCPDGKLCYNTERDKILPAPFDIGEIVAWTIVSLILVGTIVSGVYYFYKHRAELLLVWRRRKRRISDHAASGDDKNKNGNIEKTTEEQDNEN